ncbi:hypothetical protein ACFFMN_05010 [Planobispora siamensis]|uniref:Uncharacterized protein n=1 Tax=Planobispora siamensis TaxID=936338 RepID=A0A8J3SG32_9ACTN|nr:hypothetical protein [Planobispora siamensis]GIH92277.1 hypothetical protein Psi01_29070 [Planobispora siamensis]
MIREPVWTDYGVLEAYELTDDDSDPFEDGLLDRLHGNDLAATTGSASTSTGCPGRARRTARSVC